MQKICVPKNSAEHVLMADDWHLS